MYIYAHIHTHAPFHVWVRCTCSLKQSPWNGTGLFGSTQTPSCKAAAVQSLLVEQLTVHTNINVWKCSRSATEPHRIPVSGAGMLIKTRRKYPACESQGKERKKPSGWRVKNPLPEEKKNKKTKRNSRLSRHRQQSPFNLPQSRRR